MKILKITFINFLFLSSSFCFASTFEKFQAILEKATVDSPKVAKLACSEHIASHIRGFGLGLNPVKRFRHNREFKIKRDEYLGDLYNMWLLDFSESSFVKSVSRRGYRDATIDSSFYASVASLFSSDVLQLMHF